MHHFMTRLSESERTEILGKSVGSQYFLKMSQPIVTITVNSMSRVVAGLRSEYVQFPDIEEEKPYRKITVG